MKILFFAQVGQTLFGANRSLLDVVQGLFLLGHDVRVFCTEKWDLARQLELKNIPVFYIQYRSSAISLNNKFFITDYLLSFWKQVSVLEISKKLQSWLPEIVYSNNTTIDIWFKLAEHLKIPHVWHVREFWWEDYSLLYCPTKKAFLSKLNQSRLVIFISQSLQFHYKDIINTKHTVLINPITNLLQKSKIYAPSSQNFIFLFPWYIHKNKWQFIWLRSFRRISKDFKNVQLMFLWSGPRSYVLLLKIYCFVFWIKNVKFLGYSIQPEKYFSWSNAVIVASKKEALGRVTLEAMMHGVPVIWRNTGGTLELIRDGRWIIFDGSVDDLTKKMYMLLQNYHLGQKCVDRATKYINSFCLKSIYIHNLEKLLLSLIK